jgi:thiamine biosynthesis protein ThiS
MKLSINGEQRELEGALTIEGLLKTLGIEPAGIAVEVNRVIVPRGRYTETVIKDGDAVEIVRMTVGG